MGQIPALISISIVSHRQAGLVKNLLEDFRQFHPKEIEILLTLNVHEPLTFSIESFPFAIKLLQNASPKGFAANHNTAFKTATGQFFCVLNPDIRLASDPFPALIKELGDSSVGVAAPLIMGPDGTIEDSARPFPTPLTIFCKAIGVKVLIRHCGEDKKNTSPDWVGGMFMLFRKEIYADIQGFDTAYRLYYEDVDLCARLRLRGYDVRFVPKASATHLARRQSRRDLKYFIWHVRSMLRFFFSETYREIQNL